MVRLIRYLDEEVYRLITKNDDEKVPFVKAKSSVAEKRLTYKELTEETEKKE